MRFCPVAPFLADCRDHRMYQLDPFTRLVRLVEREERPVSMLIAVSSCVSGLVSSVLHNVPIVCRENEYSVFSAFSGSITQGKNPFS